jgi:peptide/nickel transport system substrate-binding protein
MKLMVIKMDYLVHSVIIAMICLVMGCGSNDKSSDISGKMFPRNKTLYVGGFQWGAPKSFNPFVDEPAFPMTGDVNLIYESMFGFNLLTGELEPVIGKEYLMEDSTLTILLNENAKWQDGSPLTSDDVIYTFLFHKHYPTVYNTNWMYIQEIKANGPYSVILRMSKESYNRIIMKDIIASTPILPKKYWASVEEKIFKELGVTDYSDQEKNLAVFEKIKELKNDTLPLGSGPYTLKSYSDEIIVLKRVDAYWGDIMHNGTKAAPEYIVHPVYESNDKYNLGLQQGDLDMSQMFCPQIWNKFSKGVGTWMKEKPYYIPGTIVCLLPNLTKETPLKDVVFRRAIAYAVDVEQIRNLSIYGYAPPLKPGFIIDYGSELEYYNEEDAGKYGITYNPEKAREILKNAGYTWGTDSMLIDPKGKKMQTLYLTCPSGWTDWESAIRIAVDGMRFVGMNVREKFIEDPEWFNELANGLFDLTMRAPMDLQTASLPWSRFERALSTLEWAEPGEPMWHNEGRYRNPVADSLIAVLPKQTDDAQILKTYRALNVLFMKELPVIPVMYRPWLFYQFSTRHWTNFPTEDNPHSPPQCLFVGAGITALWNIKPTGK